MADDIPTELWLQIARYIPEKCLRDMLKVNRIFFHLAMDIRYKDILIKSLDRSALRIVARLSDPSVASRVRSLKLQLNPAERHPIPSSPPLPSTFNRLKAVLHFHRRSPSPRPLPKSFEGVIACLSAAFPDMFNLEALTLHFWNWPLQDLDHFLATAWASFGGKLRRLSFGGSLDAFQVLPASKIDFHSIQELEFEFTSNPDRRIADGDARVLVEHVVPFVNHVAPQLLALKVWSFAFADLSSFFKQLTGFPVLDTFILRAAFNRSFSEDPSGLTQLLHNSSSTLKALHLRLNPSGLLHPNSDEQLAEWLSQTIASKINIASNLHTLQIYPSMLDSGFDTLILCLKQSSHSLKKLTIYDRYLHYAEVAPIVAELPSQLVYLRLNVFVLSVALLDLLADRLPNLAGLALHIASVVGVEGDPLSSFTSEVTQRTYRNWKLDDLSIWQGGNELDYDTMHVLEVCIPSLCSFWGQGHK